MMAAAPILRHPAAQRDRALGVGSIFGLVGGPLAWYAQLCAGYALASWPCFPKDVRSVAPLTGYAWTWLAMIAALIGAVAIALAAFFVSWRAFTCMRRENAAVERPLEKSRERQCFLAFWGMWLGAGFALATLLTAVAFMVLPRCAG